jgi:hypothetical protein
LHYWIGSINDPQAFYKNFYDKFNILTDTLKIVLEFENKIPDKSWMLYLLEIFNSQQIAVELNLICQFDNQNYFEAIFNGINRYRFIKVLPIVGNRYLRQINFQKSTKSIEYYVKDLENQIEENFILEIEPHFSFQFSTIFTGVEWWNKIDYRPYPIRYKIEISNLMYGFNDDATDNSSLLFFPIDSLFSNKDELFNHSLYPLSFRFNSMRNGCICYNIENGFCAQGLNYNHI